MTYGISAPYFFFSLSQINNISDSESLMSWLAVNLLSYFKKDSLQII